MPIIEALESGGPGGLEGQQVGPASQKIQSQGGAQVFAGQFQGLGIIGFEQTGQLIESLGAPVYQIAAQFHQSPEFARCRILQLQRAQLGLMAEH